MPTSLPPDAAPLDAAPLDASSLDASSLDASSLDDVCRERDGLAARLRALHEAHALRGAELDTARAALEQAVADREALQRELASLTSQLEATAEARTKAEQSAVALAAELEDRSSGPSREDLEDRVAGLSADLARLREELTIERARAQRATTLDEEVRDLLATLTRIDERAAEQRDGALARVSALVSETHGELPRRPERRQSSASIPAPPIVHVAPLEHLTLDVSDLDD